MPLNRAQDPEPYQIAALVKGLELLSAFDEGELLGNADLVARTGFPKATVSRFTTTLQALGYLRRDATTRKFLIGTRLAGIGARLERNSGLLRAARPHMTRLAEQTNMSVCVGTRDRLGVVFLEVVRPRDNRLVINSDAGTAMPLESTAIGLCYITAASTQEKSQLIADLTARHPQDWPDLRRKIERAAQEFAQKAYVSSKKSWGRDVNAVAVPLVRTDPHALYVFNCAGPASQLSHHTLHGRIAPMLLNTVRLIERDLAVNPTVPLKPPQVHIP